MKILVKNYTFSPNTANLGTITFTGYSSLTLNQLLLITNTTKNTIIYNFADPTAGGSISGNVLSLSANTSTMSSGDSLQIFIDDFDLPADQANQLTSNVILSSIAGFNFPAHDYRTLNYNTATNTLTSVQYRVGGSNGTVVGTRTLTYDSNGNITGVGKS
jgi:hypothetical protein